MCNPMNDLTVQAATRQNLRTLCLIRLIPLSGMLIGIYYLLNEQHAPLRWDFILALLAAFILIVAFTWLRSFRPTPISHGEFLGHLAVDVAIYSLLMFNTGGASNPFVSYLLVPVTIAAITLPAPYTWTTALLCLMAYSTLLFWHIPLPSVAPGHGMGSGHGDGGLNPHLVGMWINFVASAILIAYFINKMAATLREQEQSLNRQKQQQLEDGQLLAIASLAASAAHELGTPLNTIKLITDEWQGETLDGMSGEMKGDVNVIRAQIQRCQESLRKLSGTARSYSEREYRRTSVKNYFDELLESWLVMRPDVEVSITIAGAQEDVEGEFHPALTASLHNLLNNAADACPRMVEVTVSWNPTEASLIIRDYGEGIGSHITGQQPLESGKPGGMGLGLFLARSILARHGARITLEPHPKGGTQAHVILPLETGHA